MFEMMVANSIPKVEDLEPNHPYSGSVLPQELSKAIPYGSTWVIEGSDFFGLPKGLVYAGTRPPEIKTQLTAEANLITNINLGEDYFPLLNRRIYAQKQPGLTDFGLVKRVLPSCTSSLDVLQSAYQEAYKALAEFPFWAMQGCTSADFTVTHWESSSVPNWHAFDTTALNTPNLQFAQVRMQLQEWFGVSVDELAELLSLSPTTIVNLTKPGHVIRPKTVRKMMIVFGLLKEFQRIMGHQTALTWARTIGYRLLIEGNLRDFEQFISTHIFPTLEKQPRSIANFGDSDAEFNVQTSTAVGIPSRL